MSVRCDFSACVGASRRAPRCLRLVGSCSTPCNLAVSRGLAGWVARCWVWFLQAGQKPEEIKGTVTNCAVPGGGSICRRLDCLFHNYVLYAVPRRACMHFRFFDTFLDIGCRRKLAALVFRLHKIHWSYAHSVCRFFDRLSSLSDSYALDSEC